jgi:vacuolar-type H+-ATPase subunit H
MSSSDLSEGAKSALKTMKDLLEKAEESARTALNKATPAVQKSVASSMDAAAKGFNSTMKSIDGATTKEQLEVLKAYRKVLGGQTDFVDSRIKTLESKEHPPN